MSRIAIVLLCALLAACTAGQPGAPGPDVQAQDGATVAPPVLAPSEPFDLAQVTLTSPSGEGIDVPVYVADEQAERMRGLMEREELPAGTGMVFLFPSEHRGGFWMKNTRIPLSIAFFDETGEVLAVLDMDPCERDPCPSYEPGVSYLGALEVNQGFFAEIGLEPGWRVELPSELSRDVDAP